LDPTGGCASKFCGKLFFGTKRVECCPIAERWKGLSDAENG
jgi:hypothetical protein